jgi:hypothetical protein
MNKISYDSINSFLERVRTAIRAKSKEVRLGITEAEDIALVVGQMTARETTLQQQIIDLQQQVITLQQSIGGLILDIEADAGSFKDSNV